MEDTSEIRKEEITKLNVDIDEPIVKDLVSDNDNIEAIKEKEDEGIAKSKDASIDYDESDDSEDDIAVITQNSSSNYLGPSKNSFSIKTQPVQQITSNYKMSKTAVDLEHPGNINGVPTVDFDIYKLTDDCKPWKKPGADVSDFFNYGFVEETWLMYCEKQKSIRLIKDSSDVKSLGGFTNLPYNLSGSHINVGFSRNSTRISNDGPIDVIGSQQNDDLKSKPNESYMTNKISTIPVQTGHVNINLTQPGNFMAGFPANHPLSSNLLNPIMSVLGMLPNPGNVNFFHNGPIDQKMTQYHPGNIGLRNYGNSGNNWTNNQNYGRQNSADHSHVNDDFGEKKNTNMKSDRNNRRNDNDESRQIRSRDRRDNKSPADKRHRSRSNSRDHKYSRRSNRKRSSDDGHRRSKHSRDRSKERRSSEDSDKGGSRHYGHKSSKTGRRSKSRSREDRHRRTKSPRLETVDLASGHLNKAANIKKEKGTSHGD